MVILQQTLTYYQLSLSIWLIAILLYYYCRLTALCVRLPGWAGTYRKVKPVWIYRSKRQWVAVVLAGLYANQHSTKPQTDNHASRLPTTQFFTGWVSFLPPNQQRHSTEGSVNGSIGLVCRLRCINKENLVQYYYLHKLIWITSPQSHLRKARRSSADKKNSKLLLSHISKS